MSDQALEGFSLSPQQNHLWRTRRRAELVPWRALAELHVEGPLDEASLRDRLESVASRNEILRTAFPILESASIPLQVVLDESPLRVEQEDCRELSDAALAERKARLWEELKGECSSLEEGAVLRAVLLTRANDRHELLVAQPALCADPTSLWNLARELVSPAGPAPDGDEGSMQYADIAQWLHDLFDSEEAGEGIEYWKKVVRAERSDLRIPLESNAAPEARFDRGEVTLDLGDAGEALEKYADAKGVDPGHVVFAAWLALLGRLGDSSSPMAGFASTGRAFEGLDEALGFFQKYLPVAPALDKDKGFASFVASVVEATSAACEWHEFYEPERVAPKEEQRARYLYQALPAEEPLEGDGLRLRLGRRWSCSDVFDLELVWDGAAGELRLGYDARLYGEVEARILLGQARELLQSACEDSETPISEVSMLPSDQRETLLSQFAQEGEAPAAERRIHDLIVEQCSATPAAVAVAAQGTTLSYAELDDRSNRLARHLGSLGVRPGTYVGLYLDRSVDMVVSILAVHKAGGAYLPLPPNYPAERILFMLADTEAAVVLTRAEEGHSLPEAYSGTVVELDRSAQVIAAQDASPFDGGAAVDDPAYVIYTSGSTGKPKGVPISHMSLCHSTAARTRYYRRPVGSYLLLSSFAFDSSVAGIFWTLVQGGRLVLPEDGFEREVSALPSLIREHGVTHILGLPSLYSLILGAAKRDDLLSLQTVIVAGESCPKELIARHFEILPETELHDEYGPTEGTVWTTVFDCSTALRRNQVPIGRPIPGARVYVLDSSGQPAAIGASGEIHVGGAGLTHGYLNRPKLNAEKFIPDPFQPGQRLYRTGDLARFLPDGNLEFLGRIDHQVKIRGYRIELEEIESVLATHAAVQETVVVAREDTPGDQRIVAYVTSTNDSVPKPDELREHLAGPLPEYMLPSAFVVLTTMPRLPNGKVNRLELPAPDAARNTGQDYAPPTTPLQKVVCGIWAEILGVERVGVEDDFFALGGHSILATQLFARLNESMQMSLPLRMLFDHPTVAGLTQAMLEDASQRPRIERTAEILLQVLELEDEQVNEALEGA